MKRTKTVIRGVSNFDDLEVLADISDPAKLREDVLNDAKAVVLEIEFLNPSDAVGLEKEKL